MVDDAPYRQLNEFVVPDFRGSVARGRFAAGRGTAGSGSDGGWLECGARRGWPAATILRDTARYVRLCRNFWLRHFGPGP